MDFERILHAARRNELNKKEPVKWLQTKFKPPTKEQREKDKVLSEGVQRFLARKEEEEREKQREAERRKKELMALRAKDPKANRRVQTMLKRTKSANKSVMEDAVDNNNTADTLGGPSQPDEDDYGFVSETSSQLYNKLIQKMYSMPSDDLKFAPSKKPNSGNLSNTKERVKMALLKQEEDEKLPHKRKRKGDKKYNEEDSQLDYSVPDRDLSSMSTEKEKSAYQKPKKVAPPPMDFHELLKIAEKKQHEPIVFEKEKKIEEPEVLMTKKQKLEYEKIQELKRRRELGLQNSESNSKSQKDDKSTLKKIAKVKQPGTMQKIPKLNQDEPRETSKANSKESKGPPSKNANQMQKIKPKTERLPRSTETEKKYKESDDETSRLMKERDEALKLLREKERLIKEKNEAERRRKEREQLIRERDEAVRKLKMLEKADRANKPFGKANSSVVPSGTQKTQKFASVNSKSEPTRSEDKFSTTNGRVGPSKVNKPLQKDGRILQDVPSRNQVKQFPPRDVKPVRRFPPSDGRRRPPPIKRRRLDSDDEYDPDMADFIDDGEADVGPEDVSKVISEIFRYNKNGYSKYDDMDDECMESNYAQISKEEFFSTKAGILEDLEDIQRKKAALARRKKRPTRDSLPHTISMPWKLY